MRDFKKLEEPKTIATNGNKKVFSTATGTIWGYVIVQAGTSVSLFASRPFSYLDWNAASPPPSKQCNQGKQYPRDGKPPLAFRQQQFAPARPTPKGQGRMLLRSISSLPGRHGRYVINECLPAVGFCSTDKRRRQSRRLHLERDPRILHQLRRCHGAHHDSYAPTEEGILAVWIEASDPKGVHTNRRKQNA